MAYCEVNSNIVNSLKSIVGEKYVTTSQPILASYVSKSIMGLESTTADVVVRPKYTEEVRKILIVANNRGIPITPYSGGLSGGYSCPIIKPGGILIDLGRMNKIIEVNTDCRYVVIEPAVSSGEIWSYFRRNYPEWCPPIPDGAPPAATVVGDALERGFSLVTSRYGPGASVVLGMEVVLPTGDVIRTGSWALPGAKPFYTWGLGPDINGLFLGAQGTMGVITKMSVKIFPHPEHKTIIAYGFKDPDDMARASLDVLKKEIGVMVQGGNWWLVPTRMVTEAEAAKMATREFWAKAGVPEWFMNFEIWGRDEEDLANQVKTVHTIMANHKANGMNVEEWKLHPRQIASRLLKPNKIAIPYALWKGSYLFITWYTPWSDSGECARICCEKMEEHGIPPVMWIASIEMGRQAICMPIVCFDPTKQEEIQKVQDFNRETTEIFLDKGWINYRMDPFIHAPATYMRAKGYYNFLKKIKKILDPNGIMHPGRLCLP